MNLSKLVDVSIDLASVNQPLCPCGSGESITIGTHVRSAEGFESKEYCIKCYVQSY